MMKKNYLGSILVISFMLCQSFYSLGQGTYFGVGSGTNGKNFSHFGIDAGKNSSILTYDNTFIGYSAGYSTLGGIQNTFIGSRAGYANNGGYENVFIGTSTGINNQGGSQNTFVGSDAGYSNVSGFSNTYIGNGSGMGSRIESNKSKNASRNIFIGPFSGFNDFSDDNICIGYGAGKYIGNKNTIVGTEGIGKSGGENISYSTIMGYRAGYNLESGSQNTMLGSEAGLITANGSSNTFVGTRAGSLNKNGNENTYIGYLTGALGDLTNATAIGSRAIALIDNSVILGYNSNVGIGTAAPTYQLHLTKDEAAKPGSNVWTIASDKRLKKDITPYKEGLSTIIKINPVWFSYNGQAGTPTDKKFVGVIAQEMQQIAPYTVGKYVYIDSTEREEYLDYNGNAVTYMLINSIKELNQVIEKQNQRISELEKKLSLNVKPNTTLNMGAELYQNVPNPFSIKTEIACYIPEEIQIASIIIFDMNGKKLKSIPVIGKGKTSVIIEGRELNPGMYFYSLIVDGKEVDVKRMILE